MKINVINICSSNPITIWLQVEWDFVSNMHTLWSKSSFPLGCRKLGISCCLVHHLSLVVWSSPYLILFQDLKKKKYNAQVYLTPSDVPDKHTIPVMHFFCGQGSFGFFNIYFTNNLFVVRDQLVYFPFSLDMLRNSFLLQ